MTIFSDHSLNSLLTGFSHEERRDLEDKLGRRLKGVTRGRSKADSGDFYLCVGGAGSGNIDHVKQLGKLSAANILPVLTSDLRKKLLVYKNLKAKGYEGDDTDENPHIHERADIFYDKSSQVKVGSGLPDG